MYSFVTDLNKDDYDKDLVVHVHSIHEANKDGPYMLWDSHDSPASWCITSPLRDVLSGTAILSSTNSDGDFTVFFEDFPDEAWQHCLRFSGALFRLCFLLQNLQTNKNKRSVIINDF